MKTQSIHINSDDFTSDIDAIKNDDAQLVIVFTSRGIIEKSTLISVLKNNFKNARIVGCSTAGEIGESVEDDSIVIQVIEFENTELVCTSVEIDKSGDSFEAGKKTVSNLIADNLKGIFVLAPGWNINGSDLVEGMREALPEGVSLSGGLAGDGTEFQETCTILDEGVSSNQIVAFGLYGDHVSIKTGSRGGWKTFGPQRKVTRSDKNVLFELDGKPALDLYKEYLGDKADNLPASGLLYPFAILDGQNKDKIGLVRTILSVDDDNKSLTFAGNLVEDSVVSLMHASTDELSNGAYEAARICADSRKSNDNSAAVICVSCVGRKILMGDDTEEELDVVRETIDNVSISGFHSYGEISHFETTNRPELHNQTMTITLIEEYGS